MEVLAALVFVAAVDVVMSAVSPSAGAPPVPGNHLVVPPAYFFVAELPGLSSDVAK
jgi:hypothetical protein